MKDKDNLTEYNVLSKYIPNEKFFSANRLLNCETAQQYLTAYDDLMKSIDLRDNQYLQDNWLCEKYKNMWIKLKRIENKAVYKIEYNGANATLISSKNSSTVYAYLNNPLCDGFDFGSTLLPCRHVIYVRKTSNVQIITEKMINQRLENRLHEINVFQTPIETTEPVSHISINSLISKSSGLRH
ncbi:unnamed protein product [Brachionus calyciflorus]|uniref:Uncharacterized protein n=1 Tax=Brachionus calyciflorus TaxID=104777 RepID=A0A814L258_9BILA|nr:unnamed protein product [Brachionus calyciflorus]